MKNTINEGKKPVAESYQQMRARHQAEVDAFPMAFAFNESQFEEGMRQLGLDPTETNKIFRLGDTGGFYRRKDSKALMELRERHGREMEEAVQGDPTGDGFIYQMFYSELGNHEYSYTEDVEETLMALDLTMEQVEADKRLHHGLKKAMRQQLKYSA